MTAEIVESGFSLADIMDALREGPGPDLTHYKSVLEWCAILGTHEKRMQAIIRQAQAAGIVDFQRVQRPAIDGSSRWSNLYAFQIKKKETVTDGTPSAAPVAGQ